jgi:aspartate aminotransferase-like enzyme
MKAYEGGSAAYFATPPVNLINAYRESLTQITKASPSLDERLRLHRETSGRIKATAKELGLSQLPIRPEIAANGMTAVSTTNFISKLVDEPRVPPFIALVPGWRKVLRASARLPEKRRCCSRGPRY